ncbi:MAG: SDR family NAD(P)-dependent oxidoreductase, partial [Pseudomonadota bacterium]|nr:SDR family NAD(P)-dependent oxidoreductase [Pseudomonadota bacterium]
REKIDPLGAKAVFHRLDVSDEGTVNALAKELSSTSIDLLINNATTFAHDGPRPIMLPDMDEFTQVIRVNAVAPVYVAGCFVEHVTASEMKTMTFNGTRSGSIGYNGSGGHHAYCCSNATLNMAIKCIPIEFADRGILTAVLHPGSVATETRSGGNDIPVSKSVTGMRGVIEGITPDMTRSSQR